MRERERRREREREVGGGKDVVKCMHAHIHFNTSMIQKSCWV